MNQFLDNTLKKVFLTTMQWKEIEDGVIYFFGEDKDHPKVNYQGRCFDLLTNDDNLLTDDYSVTCRVMKKSEAINITKLLIQRIVTSR